MLFIHLINNYLFVNFSFFWILLKNTVNYFIIRNYRSYLFTWRVIPRARGRNMREISVVSSVVMIRSSYRGHAVVSYLTSPGTIIKIKICHIDQSFKRVQQPSFFNFCCESLPCSYNSIGEKVMSHLSLRSVRNQVFAISCCTQNVSISFHLFLLFWTLYCCLPEAEIWLAPHRINCIQCFKI